MENTRSYLSRFSGLLLFLLTLGFQMFLYIYFKLCRTYLKYVFYSDDLYNYSPEMYNPGVLKHFKDHHPDIDLGGSWYLKQYGKLSNNVRYLTLMQISGISSFIFLLLANFSFEFAQLLNPLVIIMLYIILFYSIIIITFKHVLYYHRSKNSQPRYREFFRYGIPVIILFGRWICRIALQLYIVMRVEFIVQRRITSIKVNQNNIIRMYNCNTLSINILI